MANRIILLRYFHKRRGCENHNAKDNITAISDGNDKSHKASTADKDPAKLSHMMAVMPPLVSSPPVAYLRDF